PARLPGPRVAAGRAVAGALPTGLPGMGVVPGPALRRPLARLGRAGRFAAGRGRPALPAVGVGLGTGPGRAGGGDLAAAAPQLRAARLPLPAGAAGARATRVGAALRAAALPAV